MKLISIIVLTAIATLIMTAADLKGSDLAGIWKGSMSTQGGATDVAITIKPGADITGTIQAGEYESPIQNAKTSGDKLYFEMKMAFGTVYYDGAVSGNELRFTVTGTQGDKYALTCTRQTGGK